MLMCWWLVGVVLGLLMVVVVLVQLDITQINHFQHHQLVGQ
jgi:hypothetical protein